MEAVDIYYKPWVYFWSIQSIGLLMLAAGLVYKFSFYLSATKQSLYRKLDYRLMFKAFIREVLLQRQLAAKGSVRWLAHMSIFCGFMGLLLLSLIAVALETVIPEGSPLSQFFLQGQGRYYYKAAGDLFGVMILLAIILPLLRRYVLRDRQLYTDSSDTLALSFLFLLVTTGFLLEAARIAITGPAPGVGYSFFGSSLAGIFKGSEGIKSIASGLWVFHATLTAAFLAYLPHSKFLHIINSPIEIILNASEERMRGDLYI